ncbi:MAG: hypothetical protein PHQ75_09600 [Thermoguttaceae bacterium]|nr:hypothetical protein [Thermoguttaceae bacterium]
MKKLHQLSIFLENKPGHLLKVTQMLADAEINVETMALADTEHFGILRILVKNWEQAKQILGDHRLVVKETEVLAVKVPDRPGGLASLLAVLDGKGLNIEYMYGFDCAFSDDAVIVLRLDDTDKALKTLTDNGIEVLGDDELFH